MEIIPNIHLIPGITANPYLLVDPDGLTLIDAGLPGSQKKIFAYMAALGFAPKDLKRILITHADYDHIGALAVLKAASGARVYASQIEADAMATGKPSRKIRPEKAVQRLIFGVLGALVKAGPVQVDEILSDGVSLPLAGGLTVVETPGHTPGHLSFYIPAAGILFCGDSMVTEPDAIFPSRPGLTWERASASASVRKQAAFGARIVCSGHGPVVMDAQDKFPQTA